MHNNRAADFALSPLPEKHHHQSSRPHQAKLASDLQSPAPSSLRDQTQIEAPTQPTAQATRGTKRPPFDAGGYERFDPESGSDSDSDDEECSFMAMIAAADEYRSHKRSKLDC